MRKIDDNTETNSKLMESLDKLRLNIQAKAKREREEAQQREQLQSPNVRQPPDDDRQGDFFVPSLYDVSVKDGIDLMDLAVFRLSKSQTRKGEVLRHEINNVVIEVGGGAHGMATIWDYDLVLMSISHLADAEKRYRRGEGPKPSRRFRPHSIEILKFCRLPPGGKQYAGIEAALDRLQGTTIKITTTNAVKKSRRAGYFPLIGGATVVSRTDSGRIGQVEIVIPEWVYDGVCKHKNPDVLTLDPEYLLISGGLARFVYRLARRAAGDDVARYSFRTVHQRSGSTREGRKFDYDLRQLIQANDLPGYELAEEKGKNGPILLMRNRNYFERGSVDPRRQLQLGV